MVLASECKGGSEFVEPRVALLNTSSAFLDRFGQAPPHKPHVAKGIRVAQTHRLANH
jgi:hypothetical protein